MRRLASRSQGSLPEACRRSCKLLLAAKRRSPKAFAALALSVFFGLLVQESRADTAYQAEDHRPAVRRVLEVAVQPWVNDPIIVEALEAQNATTRDITEAEIERLDQTWRRETTSVEKPLIDHVLATELSRYLMAVRRDSEGLFTEIFVMDLRGLNVGQSDMTSDYWQGDEDKWRRSCAAGPDAIFIDEVREDESTQQFQSQLSLSIPDPGSRRVIGCITIGVDVDLAMDLAS